MNRKLIIEIDNINDAEAIAIEDMLATWINLCENGKSKWVAMFIDGENGFNPDVQLNGKMPFKTKMIDTEKLFWETIRIKVPPTKENGLEETQWVDEGEIYMIDPLPIQEEIDYIDTQI